MLQRRAKTKRWSTHRAPCIAIQLSCVKFLLFFLFSSFLFICAQKTWALQSKHSPKYVCLCICRQLNNNFKLFNMCKTNTNAYAAKFNNFASFVIFFFFFFSFFGCSSIIFFFSSLFRFYFIFSSVACFVISSFIFRMLFLLFVVISFFHCPWKLFGYFVVVAFLLFPTFCRCCCCRLSKHYAIAVVVCRFVDFIMCFSESEMRIIAFLVFVLVSKFVSYNIQLLAIVLK